MLAKIYNKTAGVCQQLEKVKHVPLRDTLSLLDNKSILVKLSMFNCLFDQKEEEEKLSKSQL